VTEQHHTASHHGNDPANITKVATIIAYHVASRCPGMQTPDGEGSLTTSSCRRHGHRNQHAPPVAVWRWVAA
jgi:hypothetical protein